MSDKVDLSAIQVRDREWGDATPGSGPVWDRDQLADAYLLAGMDRRNLLALLEEAGRALLRVGNCHGCIDTEHPTEQALAGFLARHQR